MVLERVVADFSVRSMASLAMRVLLFLVPGLNSFSLYQQVSLQIASSECPSPILSARTLSPLNLLPVCVNSYVLVTVKIKVPSLHL